MPASARRCGACTAVAIASSRSRYSSSRSVATSRSISAPPKRLLDACSTIRLSTSLCGDLLPDWYEEWLLVERESHRQLRLHALETLCERLTRVGRLHKALEVGLAAVAGEPLRESAHRAVVSVHLEEGNVSEAIRQYRLYRQLVGTELGIEPSERMQVLVRDLDGAPTVR